MMIRLLAADFLKLKRKLIWFLTFLGPFGVIALETFNFTLRYDYLTNYYKEDLWGGLIQNVQQLTVPTLLLGITIIASMLANIEHQTNAWKQLLALPISKISAFSSKFILCTILLFISSTLLGLGTVVLGIALQFGTDIPYLELAKVMYFPFLAAMPFMALQTWLSITISNQATPLTIGILGAVISMNSFGLADWIPYKWPLLINDWNEPIFSVIAGVMVGLIIYMIGTIDFVRKDVK